MSNIKCFLILISSIFAISLFNPSNLEATIYGTIKGRVISEDTGEGLAGVEVHLFDAEIGGSFGRTKTDKNGYFYFKLVKEGRYILHFSPPHPHIPDICPIPLSIKKEYPGDTRHVVTVEKGKIAYFEEILRVGGTISGLINKKEEGIIYPLQNAFIQAVSNRQYLHFTADTGPDGKYKISGLDPNDEYSLIVQFYGYGPKWKNDIRVDRGQEVSGIDFVFDFDDKTGIEVLVTSSTDGSPISKAHISFFYNDNPLGSFLTDEDGKASIFGLTPGIYEIWIYAKNEILNKKNIYVVKEKTSKVYVTLDNSSN